MPIAHEWEWQTSFSRVAYRHLTAKYGKDVFEECSRQAEQEYAHEVACE